MTTGIDRRELLKSTGLFAAAGFLSTFIGQEAWGAEKKSNAGTFMHKLPPLPYPEDALEPYIDKETVKIHHGKHFAAYVEGLNKTLEALENTRKQGNFSSVKALSRDLAFNGSGVVLHWLYFNTIGPNAGGKPSGLIKDLIDRDFGSFETFWNQFAAASKSVEASGWGILAWEPFSKRLVIMQAEKHQNLTSWGVMPLLVCDVWEHAYYLKYQNRRAEYVDNFQKIVDWKRVDDMVKRHTSAM